MNVERDAVPGRLVVTRPLPFSIRVERGRHAVTVETGPVHRRTILLGLRRVSAELEVLEHIASDDRIGVALRPRLNEALVGEMQRAEVPG